MFAAQDGSTPNGKLYVDDVFSTYLYTGNDSTQTINNGIDLAGKGGLVWIKSRNSTRSSALFCVETGVKSVSTESTAGPYNDPWAIASFNSSGFTLGADNVRGLVNRSNNTYTSWTFRKAPKFFDVVTYTGNGADGKWIYHSLGIEPGLIIIKRTDSSGDWCVYHRSFTTFRLSLNSAAAGTSAVDINSTQLRRFSVNGGSNPTNISGATYVAYLFAHDPSADGFIQCGSYSGNGSTTGPVINLGWEPQYLMIRRAAPGNWQIIDSMRGMPVGSANATLQANLSSAESSVDYVSPTATGFQITSTSSEVNSSGSTYIYLAIRRPNKPPKTGAEVYNAIARTGTGAAATVTGVGFAPDAMWVNRRGANVERTLTVDRLRGSSWVFSNLTYAETTNSTLFPVNPFSVGMDGVGIGTGDNLNSSYDYINHFFKRAPGFFDVVCYAGTGVARTVPHNLGVAPELIIVKLRNGGASWVVYSAPTGATHRLMLDKVHTSGSDPSSWNNIAPTSSVFTVGNGADVNGNTALYVAYLFATLPGISKVGSYTGNGSALMLNCGFSTGTRFILIKRTDSTGDWYVWDTARGIVAANDPHLSLNTTAAEVTTDDSVDSVVSGFVVTQNAATKINVSSGRYIFLAIS